ncbi:MAG: c-type cytochrome [Candidatus Hydrogenedentes bacterium]|nr:c-type cytochrome [Candidatus Hydrogenedentota bacterium]
MLHWLTQLQISPDQIGPIRPIRLIKPLRQWALLSAFILQTSAFSSPMVPGFERFAASPDSGVSPGLLLYNELKCGACHGEIAPMQSAFPPHAAPILDNAGARMRLDYLQAFIAAPHATKPGTSMPDLLATLEPAARAETSEALAHYLASLGELMAEKDTQISEAELEAGAALFHSVGCVACHEPTQSAQTAGPEDIFWEDGGVETPKIEVPSVPLPNLAAKTTPEALAAFLRDPAAIRPGARMPNMTLSEEEARQIAQWMTQGDSASATATIDPTKAARGKELFQTLGCASCHTIGGATTRPTATPLAGKPLSDAGCLAIAPLPNLPWFDLSEAQRTALRAIPIDAPAPTDADTINHTLLALNCYACHERNGLGGPEPGRALYFTETEILDLGDEGRLPPTLTGVGAKLTPEWLRTILTDGGRVRPYMATRMPHFGEANIGTLVEAFAKVDADPNPPTVNVSGLEHHHRNEYGRELMGTTGLGCVTCHNLNGQKSLGIPAVDLAHVPARLQPEWFMKYMLAPASLRPQTRMPAFFENGKSLSSELFKGDAVKQIEALWIYLKEVNETRLPEGMEDTGGFELIPTDAPIIHRTFIQDVGPRAIAVGFPGGLNYAFDAETCRVALLWRGRFIDAESAWADRFTLFVSPLGEAIAKLPEGPAVALNAEGPWDQSRLRFLGYRLDESRTPIFRYQLGDVIIEESLRPAPENPIRLIRRLELKGPLQTVYVRLGMESPPTPIEVTEAGTTFEEVITW